MKNNFKENFEEIKIKFFSSFFFTPLDNKNIERVPSQGQS